MRTPESDQKNQQKCKHCGRIVGCDYRGRKHKCECNQEGREMNMNEMDMALEIINAIEELSVDDFITEYNRIMNKNVNKEDIIWTSFPTYYNPDD